MAKKTLPNLRKSNAAKVGLVHDAERELISIILNKQNLQSVIMAKVTPKDFYFADTQALYNIIYKMYASSENINYKSVLDKIVNQDNNEDLIIELSKINQVYSGENNYESLIKIIFNNSSVQKLANVIKNIDQSIDREDDVTTLISQAQSEVLGLRISLTDEKLIKIKDAIESLLIKLHNRNTTGGLTGVTTGYKKLDDVTSGFQKGDLIIIAARPSMGKTAFAINLAMNASINSPTIFFSLEMPEEQITQRILSSASNVNLNIIRSGDSNQINKILGTLNATKTALDSSKLFIDDTPGLTLLEIQSRLRKAKIEYNIEICFIDYLQLISSFSNGDNRNQEIAKISQGLKMIARELEIPIVCLSQLSRSVEKREDKRPMMSDLRDSGAIEQDADIVAFLYRNSYYVKPEVPDSSNNSELNDITEQVDDTEFIISKNRNGETKTILYKFSKQNGKFHETSIE